jgi:hypothetical protein
VASVFQPAPGALHWRRDSGSVHSWNVTSMGASIRRCRRMSRLLTARVLRPFDVLLEPIESPVPKGSVPFDPPSNLVERVRAEPTPTRSSRFLRRDETRRLQRSNVLQHARDRDAERLGQRRHGDGPRRETVEDLPPTRVSERGERAIERHVITLLYGLVFAGEKPTGADMRDLIITENITIDG